VERSPSWALKIHWFYEAHPQRIWSAASGADLVLKNGLISELLGARRFTARFCPSSARSAERGDRADPIAEACLPRGQAQFPCLGCPRSSLRIYVENIRKPSTKLDPANAEAYRRNAEALPRPKFAQPRCERSTAKAWVGDPPRRSGGWPLARSLFLSAGIYGLEEAHTLAGQCRIHG